MSEFNAFFLMKPEDVKRYAVEVLHRFAPEEETECREIGDGNINYVFQVRSCKDGRSVIVKQADKLLRSSGRPLDIYRNKIEAETLKLEASLAPRFIPEVYYYDETMAALSMEDISAYKNLRKELAAGRVYGHLAENLSTFLAQSLLPTTDLVMDRREKKERVKFFTNPELCDITEDLVLTEPYYDYKGRNILTAGNEDFVRTFLYEDADLAVVVKPCGMVVHPAAGNESGTLVNALLFHMEDLSGIGGVKRPGIVHRLDKDTSGLLMVAKNDLAHQGLSDQLRARTMEKHYLAVVDGRMREPSGRVDKPIARSTKDRKRMAVDPAGREAVTEWTLLENLKNAALLDVHILTGRTHQIRVHMQSLHHPVAGDPIYGQKNGVKAPRLMLHAYTLSFTHPRTGERLSFTAPPPEAFTAAVQKWREDPAAPLPYRAAVRE